MSKGKHTEVPLRQIAHARTGDKGNRTNISLIAYDARHYDLLVEQVTPERVAAAVCVSQTDSCRALSAAENRRYELRARRRA